MRVKDLYDLISVIKERENFAYPKKLGPERGFSTSNFFSDLPVTMSINLKIAN